METAIETDAPPVAAIATARDGAKVAGLAEVPDNT